MSKDTEVLEGIEADAISRANACYWCAEAPELYRASSFGREYWAHCSRPTGDHTVEGPAREDPYEAVDAWNARED